MRSRPGERGVGLVEMVVVIPLLLLVVFGIIAFGSAYNDKIDINQGVRDGARLAAKAQFAGCSGASNTAKIESCTAQRIGGNVESDATVWVNAPTAPLVGKPVTVCAEYELDANWPFVSIFLDGKELRSETTMRIEKEDAAGLSDSSSLPGWCG
jgi:Flp pilus assembly protein TadG